MPVIAVDAIELYYEITGTSGPWLVLLHGLGSSVRDWEHQAALAGSHRVLALDLRGHGRSSRVAPTSIRELAADVAKLLRALGIESVYVAGISMGSAVALQLAADAPELVAGAIAINGGLEGPVAPEHVAVVEERVGLVETLGMRGIGEMLAPRLLPDPAQRAAFVERWAANDATCYLASLRTLIGWSVRDRAPRCPCAMITGDRDYSPVALKQRYVDELAAGELIVIPDSGHMTTHDQPVLLTRAISELVSRWSHR
jgi:3-oxoadipate enol-lactonase